MPRTWLIAGHPDAVNNVDLSCFQKSPNKTYDLMKNQLSCLIKSHESPIKKKKKNHKINADDLIKPACGIDGFLPFFEVIFGELPTTFSCFLIKHPRTLWTNHPVCWRENCVLQITRYNVRIMFHMNHHMYMYIYIYIYVYTYNHSIFSMLFNHYRP